MPVIEITQQQVAELAKQLHVSEQADLIVELPSDTEVSRALRQVRAHEALRRVCLERGYDPDSMTEDHKMDLVYEIVHED